MDIALIIGVVLGMVFMIGSIAYALYVEGAAGGFGNFVSTCNNNGITAFGVDPLPPSKDNFYVGTFATVVENSELLGDYKFDCITTHNTLHGKYHNQEELKKLFDFFKKHAKYVIITEPRENSSELLSGLKLEHAFASSHRSTFHKLYKVEGQRGEHEGYYISRRFRLKITSTNRCGKQAFVTCWRKANGDSLCREANRVRD